jgi:hypothetical protein
MSWTRHVVRVSEKGNAYGINLKKEHILRPRRRREDNIKMDLKERVWEVMYWIRVP